MEIEGRSGDYRNHRNPAIHLTRILIVPDCSFGNLIDETVFGKQQVVGVAPVLEI